MDSDTQLWNLYQLLREEIRATDTLDYQILGIAIGASALIVATGFDQTNAFAQYLVFLCVFLVTTPAWSMIIATKVRYWRLTTYLRVFIEPNLQQVKWETRLSQQMRLQFLEGTSKTGGTLLNNEGLIFLVLTLGAALIAAIRGFMFSSTEIQTVLQMTLLDSVVPVDSMKVALIAFPIILGISFSTYVLWTIRSHRRAGSIENREFKFWNQLSSSEPGVHPPKTQL
ncbi:MAG: hypothetical protein JNM70_00550 [Anaerolineae bacterium]|nr:hypothetical protein [Anaerolineae bacterium]